MQQMEREVKAEVLAPLPEHHKLFGLLDVGSATGKPTLICGPDMSGKASGALAWCAAHNVPCEARVLTPDCTAEDLFGKLVPSSSTDTEQNGLAAVGGSGVALAAVPVFT